MHTKPVLILNADYSFLSVRPLRRIISLYCLDKVKIVKLVGEEKLHSSFDFTGIPSVVALKDYVYIPHKRIKVSRKKILARDEFKCQYCGKKLTNDNATIDHVVPKSHRNYPGHTWTNIVAACRFCNSYKDDKTLEKSGMSLLRNPFEPKIDFFYHIEEEWKEFI